MLDENNAIQINQYLPLRDIVFQTLRKAILSGELEPGERLMEIQLAEKLGVSRTPVREAIRKLELEGLVVMVARKGAQVAHFTEKDIQDVLEVREALESLAAKLACKRMDERAFLKLQLAIAEYDFAAKEQDIETMIKKDVTFHETIFAASQNEKLTQLFGNMSEQVHRYRIAYLKNIKEPESVKREHLQLLEALKTRDEDLASDLAAKHIQTQRDTIMEFIRSN